MVYATSLKLLLQKDYCYYYFGVFVMVLGRYIRWINFVYRILRKRQTHRVV